MAKKVSPRKVPARRPKKTVARHISDAPFRHPEPYFLETTAPGDLAGKLKLKNVDVPLPQSTLGDLGLATSVTGPEAFPQTILIQPYDPGALVGIDATTVRSFRWDEGSGSMRPIWNSGINTSLGFVWMKIQRPGIYAPIGLPRDRLLQDALRAIARERRVASYESSKDLRDFVQGVLQVFLEPPIPAVEELRQFITWVEAQTGLGIGQLASYETKTGPGGHLLPFPLPRDANLEAFRERLRMLEILPNGLPEENLYYPPETVNDGTPPWQIPPERQPWNGIDWRPLVKLDIWKYLEDYQLIPLIPWLVSQDWWMYQHDRKHTGQASGPSNIRSTTVGSLVRLTPTSVDGPVITKPSIVNGKIYVGAGRTGGSSGGTLYKIDLATGSVEGRYPTLGDGDAWYSYQGIGGSPAVIGGRIYFTGVHGKVYCIDAASMTPSPPHPAPIWITDLKHANLTKNQPAENLYADSWSGPLVVNGKVYVGSGEGEQEDTYGFVYCLDAATGRVEWLFCTSKFSPAVHNNPNTIPASIAAPWASGAGYTVVPDPPETGASVWSSCAYDRGLNRIYVGTGNSLYDLTAPGGGTDLPDEMYGSGLLALDADTGAFRGFFQPGSDDSYRPGDADVDVPGSATVFTRGGQRVVAFGSKNGSFFLLDANTLQVLGGGMQRRQLLPRAGGSGLPGDRGTAIATVAPITAPWYENEWGIYATPAVHPGMGKLYVGLGGRGSITAPDKTPFMRALNWNTLADAWPTAIGGDGVSRYTTASPPLYTSNEVGLSSPALVHDVVFVSTNKTGLYALDAATGLCLWSATGLPVGNFALGPAISGNYVVMGAGNNVYRYRLPGPFIIRPPELYVPWWRIWPWPPPIQDLPIPPEPPVGPLPEPPFEDGGRG
jgi:outer membrane protein assembly factor BamB